MGSPIKDSSASSSKSLRNHGKRDPAIAYESGLLAVVLIVIALIAFVFSWQFGLFKKMKKFFQKKSEIDESLDNTGED